MSTARPWNRPCSRRGRMTQEAAKGSVSSRLFPGLLGPFVFSRRRLRVPLSQVLPLRFGERPRPIEPVIKLDFHVIGLKAEDRPQGRHVGGEPAVASKDIFAITDRGLDGPFTRRRGRGDNGRVEPGAMHYPTPKNPLGTHLPLDDCPHGGFHV